MKPCDELQKIVLRHYGKFETGEQSVTIQETYSQQEGVTIIGNDKNEWFDEPDSVQAFMNAGSSSRMEITVLNIKAFSEGSVGWTMDRVAVKLPNGVELPVRHTRIFHKEGAAWKLVHLHVSIAVSDESMGN